MGQEYGDLTIGKMKVAEFQGKISKPATNGRKFVSPLLDAVPSGDVPLEILRHKMSGANSIEEVGEYQKKIRQMEKVRNAVLFSLMLNNFNGKFHFQQKRQHLIDTLKSIVLKSTNGDQAKTSSILSERMKLTDFTCYEELVRAFSQRCFHLPAVNSFSPSSVIIAVLRCV